MLELDGYKAWVEVDGRPLTEYKIEDDPDGHTVRCWVPSEEGKTFTVSWKDEKLVYETCGYVYIDGQYGDARLIGTHSDGQTTLDTIPIDNYTKAKMSFGKMNLTDDDSVVLDEATAKDLGTIKLKITSGTRGERSYDYNFKGIQQKSIHEKMKKAGGHQITVGEAMPAVMNRVKFYPDGLPSTQFIFQYRPLEMLRAMEIAPPAPRPPRDSPRTKKEKKERQRSVIVISSDEEDDEEIQRLQAQLAKLKNRKRKSGEGGSEGSPSGKRPKLEKGIKTEGGVIDLT